MKKNSAATKKNGSVAADAFKLLKEIESAQERFEKEAEKVLKEIEEGIKNADRQFASTEKDLSAIDRKGAEDLDRVGLNFLSKD